MLKSPFLKKLLPSVLLVTLLPVSVSAETTSFTDLSSNNRYAPAIYYLAEVGIIKGYSDGTFKPDQSVNRAEFLKLALEGSDITSDTNEQSGFSDVDETAWYAKYVRKAKHEGWIEGYPDGTFRPSQNINKVEALKIIGEIQQWQLPDNITEKPFIDIEVDEWFTPYIIYAKNRNLLEENTSTYIPEVLLSRAKISELMFRSFITLKSGEETFSTRLIDKYPASLYVKEETADTSTNEPALSYKTFSKEFFDNITLDSETPNTFYKNEIYQFSGKINSGEYEQAFIFLTPDNSTNDTQDKNFVTYQIDSEGNFSIPVYFTETGNYQLGIIPGKSGQSKILNLSVISILPAPGTAASPSQPTTPQIKYSNDQTTLNWQPGDNELKRFSFIQNSQTVTFYNRQNITSLPIDYPFFQDLNEGPTSLTVAKAKLSSNFPLQIASDWSKPAQYSFEAITHQYSSVKDTEITYSTLPDTEKINTKISFSGKTKTDIESTAAIITPEGKVEDVPLTTTATLDEYFGQPTIPENSSYSFSYTPTQKGTYIIELNSYDGSAVINIPVYVSTGIPLLPDFFDLNKYSQPSTDFNLFTARNKLLTLINQTRSQYGLSTLDLDSDLNQLAQLYSEDMNARDFFGHVNPDGETSDDRRLDQGITTTVGENLAIAPTIEYTHFGLLRSAVHRKNILEPDWTKIGIGIVQNSENSLIVTEEFSLDEYNELYLNNAEESLKESINNLRATNGIPELTSQFSLQSIADEWSQKMVDQDFFDFEAPNGESLSNMVAAEIPSLDVQALILNTSTVSSIEDKLLTSQDAISADWKKIGIGLANTSDGQLKVTVLFSN